VSIFLIFVFVFQNSVSGLSPNPDLHKTFLDVEPVTGKTINAFRRLQFNIGLKRTMFNRPDLTFLSQNDVFMPLFWAEETSTIKDADASTLASTLYVRPNQLCFRCISLHHILDFFAFAQGPAWLVWIISVICLPVGGAFILLGWVLQCCGASEFGYEGASETKSGDSTTIAVVPVAAASGPAMVRVAPATEMAVLN
jgi:hypothetical protein